MLRNRTIILIAVILSIIVIAVAIIASDSAQYSNPITIENGKAYVHTTDGDQVYKDVEYITGAFVSVKPSAINTITPATLPNTSAPHGTFTCDMGGFTVTNDTPCNER